MRTDRSKPSWASRLRAIARVVSLLGRKTHSFSPSSPTPTGLSPRKAAALPARSSKDAIEHRWSELLNALRFTPTKWRGLWARTLKEGLSAQERKIHPKNAQKLLDAALIGRRWMALDAMVEALDREAFRGHLGTRSPSLAKWAANALENADLLPSRSPDLIEWARQKGAFSKDLRKSHVADALESGDAASALQTLRDAGLERLEGEAAREIVEALAQKTEWGHSTGLGPASIEALSEVLGSGLESLAGLPAADLAWLIAKLLDAMAQSEEAEREILRQASLVRSKRARALIARALAMQAASQDRAGLLRSALLNSPTLLGESLEQALGKASPVVVARVGALRARAQIDSGATLREAALLSGSVNAIKTLDELGAPPARPQASNELVRSAAKDVRHQVMRSELPEQYAAVWRETLAQWKAGQIVAVNSAELAKKVEERWNATQKTSATPS